MPTLIIDNGSYLIKAGFAGSECRCVNNLIARSKDKRVYLADELLDCQNFAGLQMRRPVEKGQLYSWQLQKAVWDWIFEREVLGQELDAKETTLIMTEYPYTLEHIRVNSDQIVFEEYEFYAYRRCIPQSLVPWSNFQKLFGLERDSQDSDVRDCCLVVDTGFNATNVVPVIKGESYMRAIRRVDVGGKLLTNYLKELVSFRYYNMMEETYIINQVKEHTCFVSKSFVKDLNACKNDPKAYEIGYALPDYIANKKGRVLTDLAEVRKLQKTSDQQVLTLANERFSVPELLFDPMGIDLNEAGIPGTVSQSIAAAPIETQSLLWANIVLTGGTSLIPGLKERLETELRAEAPQEATVRVLQASNPVTCAWNGGSQLGLSDSLGSWIVTRAEYLEIGETACARKFGKNPALQ